MERLNSGGLCRIAARMALFLAGGLVLLVPRPAPASAPAAETPRILVVLQAESPEAMTGLWDFDLDVWSVDADRATALVTPDQKERLLNAGFRIEDERVLETRSPSVAEIDGYFSYLEYSTEMALWAQEHPDIVSLTSIGKSWEGRDIWLLKISDNVTVDEDEPEVLLLALQHAREWLGGMTLRGIAKDFIDQYGTDPAATDLVDSLELYFVLVANPDGYAYTHTTDRFWRKNRRDNGNGTYGVDLNRNFPFQWTSSSSSSNTYGGPSPLSEPENQAVVDWVLGRTATLAGCLNYHTYNTRVMHNWAYTYALPPNVDLMGPLAREVALAIESVNGQRMRNGSWAITLDYTGGGATVDTFHAMYGIPTLTLELRPGDGVGGGFAPPGTMIAPSVSENIVGCRTFLAWARTQAEDLTTPTISNIQISEWSNTRVTLSWDTDDPADRAVEYALPGQTATVAQPDRLRGLHHRVVVTGLLPDTTYEARVRSENLAGLVARSGVFTFQTAATAQDLTPPNPPVLLFVRGDSQGRLHLQWSPSSSSDVAGYRIYEVREPEPPVLLLGEQVLGPGATEILLDSGPATAVRSLYMVAVDGATVPNESVPTDRYAVRADPSTTTTVLVVDGYDRWTSKREAQGLNHAFAADHGRAVGAWHVNVDTCANETLGGLVDPATYTTVVWVVGDESTSDETFSSAEQTLVRSFVEGGGNLFVSGSEIAWDLDRPTGPSTADRNFFNTVLCADYVLDNTSTYDVVGTGLPPPLDFGTIRFDDGSRGIYRVWTPDAVAPSNGAAAVLRTASGRVCGIARTGLFGAGTREGRVVYFTFPFETVFPDAARIETMGRILGYFGLAGPGDRNGLVVR